MTRIVADVDIALRLSTAGCTLAADTSRRLVYALHDVRAGSALSAMTVPALVDAFVEKVNSGPRMEDPIDEVPLSVRENVFGWTDDHGFSSWRIVRIDNATRIGGLERRMARRFPPSFRDFVSRYSFAAFECGPLMFFANAAEETYWDLSRKLFLDPVMSPFLLDAGFIQIGNPYFYNYDPVCFDCNLARDETRLVQLDHEAILCHREIRVVKETAPSFVELLRAFLKPP